MTMKKGQVSIYLLIGIVLLIVVGLFVAISTIKQLPTETTSEEQIRRLGKFHNVESFVQNCVDNTAKYALFYLGFVGGDLDESPYNEFDEPFYQVERYYSIPYFYYLGDRRIPRTKSYFTEKILEPYINQNLKSCTDSFKDFPNLEVKDEDVKTSITLTDNEVIFNVNYPVYATLNRETALVGPDYTSRVQVRLSEIISTTDTILNLLQIDDRYVHWDFFAEQIQNGFNITAYAQPRETVVYRIVDRKNEVLNEPYIFQFAAKIN
jgi:hypothetical protein